jgi:transposase
MAGGSVDHVLYVLVYRTGNRSWRFSAESTMLVVMEVPPNNPDCPQCKLLLEQIKRLEQRLEAVERESKRQAGPFRKKRKPLPKKPGRKKGDDYGKHQRRAAPATIDETYAVPLPEACPDCGETNLTETEPVVQYQTDIPRTVINRQFNIATGVCCGCGCRVQGRHELQTSDATGAVAAQFGPNLHAVIALANKELGLSHGKVRRLLHSLFDLASRLCGSYGDLLPHRSHA